MSKLATYPAIMIVAFSFALTAQASAMTTHGQAWGLGGKLTLAADPSDCSQLSTIDKARVGVFTENMQETLDQANSFTAGRGWYVKDFNDRRNEYLWAAISPDERKKFLDGKGHLGACLSGLLDQIAAAAKKTLPLYRPIGYEVRSPSEERLMKAQVNDLAQATVLKIGLLSATWNIQKNSIGIPERRFKHGMIWAKYPQTISLDGYCRIIYVNIIQEYSGGGTWNSSFAQFIKSEPAGCGAVVK